MMSDRSTALPSDLNADSDSNELDSDRISLGILFDIYFYLNVILL